jgi:hypothetical protein
MDGDDGLTCGDLPELRHGSEPRLAVPDGSASFLIHVPARLSKNALGYVTFGPLSEAGEAVLSHLAERARAGEKLGPKRPLPGLSALGARNVAHKGVGGFLTTKSVTIEIRKAIRVSGVGGGKLRPYAAGRCYYSTQSIVGRMQPDVREATMGHNLGVSGRYNLSKKLPEHVISTMRDAYEEAMPALLTAPQQKAGRDVGTLKLLFEEVLGVPEGKISEEELRDATPEELKTLTRKYLGQGATQPQRVVSNGEVPKLLGERWTFVATLADDQVILRPPE